MSDDVINDNNEEAPKVEEVNWEELANDYKAQFESVKAKADQLLDETKKAKHKAREEAELAAQAVKDRAQKNGDFEQLLKSSEAERQALSEQLQKMQQSVSQKEINNQAMKIAAELADGSNAELLSEFVVKRLKYTDDGIKVTDADGNLTVSNLDALKSEFQNSDKFKSLLRGSQASGGSAAGDGGSASGSTVMARAQFDQLSPSQQMDFVKSGGKLKDK